MVGRLRLHLLRKPARKRRGGWIGPSRHAAHQRANATNRAAWWVDRPILPRRPADLLPATGRSVPSPKIESIIVPATGRSVPSPRHPLSNVRAELPAVPSCKTVRTPCSPCLKRVSKSASCAVHLKSFCRLLPVLPNPCHFGSRNKVAK